MSEFKDGDVIFIPKYNVVEAQICRNFGGYCSLENGLTRDGPHYWNKLESHDEKQAIRNLISFLEKEYLSER